MLNLDWYFSRKFPIVNPLWFQYFYSNMSFFFWKFKEKILKIINNEFKQTHRYKHVLCLGEKNFSGLKLTHLFAVDFFSHIPREPVSKWQFSKNFQQKQTTYLLKMKTMVSMIHIKMKIRTVGTKGDKAGTGIFSLPAKYFLRINIHTFHILVTDNDRW